MMPDSPKCEIEHKCPWGYKPVCGGWAKDLSLFATDCILYTDCPRKDWTEKQWKNNRKL